MVSEDLILLGNTVGIQFLNGSGNQAMQAAPLSDQQRVVSDILGEGMLEHVSQFRKDVLLINQLECFEFLQAGFGLTPDFRQTIQQTVSKGPADDGRQLKCFFGSLLQAVDPGHDHILDGIGNQHVIRSFCQNPAVFGSPDNPGLPQGLDNLFDKKRVALPCRRSMSAALAEACRPIG